MTKEQYWELAPSFNLRQHRIDQLIDQIPKNINPTGPTYKKRVRDIKNSV